MTVNSPILHAVNKMQIVHILSGDSINSILKIYTNGAQLLSPSDPDSKRLLYPTDCRLNMNGNYHHRNALCQSYPTTVPEQVAHATTTQLQM